MPSVSQEENKEEDIRETLKGQETPSIIPNSSKKEDQQDES